MRFTSFLLALALLAVAPVARAEGPRVGADATLLAGASLPTGWGDGFLLGLDFGGERVAVGLGVRYAHYIRIPGRPAWQGSNENTQYAAAVTLRLATSPTESGWAAYGRLGAGVGGGDSCVGDLCGAIGFFGSLELGANVRVVRDFSFSFGIEAAVQVGTGATALLPSLVLGLRI